MWITTVFLALTARALLRPDLKCDLLIFHAVTVSLTIIFRIANLVVSPIDKLPKDSILAQGVDIFQIATLATSLLSNFTATGVVGATAW